MKDFAFILSTIVGFGYISWVIAGKWSLRPKDQYYNRLHNQKDFLLNLLISFGLSVIGLLRVQLDARESMYFAPLIFLILFKVLDKLSLLLYGRHMILAIGRMDRPKGKNGHKFTDGLFVFLLIFIPILTCGLIMNKINHGVWMK